MTTDSVSDERLRELLDWLPTLTVESNDLVTALRELRSLRARHKEAVGLLRMEATYRLTGQEVLALFGAVEALRDIDWETDDYEDITKSGAPHLAMRIKRIVRTALSALRDAGLEVT